MEIFKTIPKFPDYEVSNYGRVKTKSRKLRYTHAVTGKEHFRVSEERYLKFHFNKLTGYKFHQLYLNKKMYNRAIHALVADAFLEKKDGDEVVNHKDGNKHNNTVENLEWCTNKYNHEHATKTGLLAKGERVATSVLNEFSVLAIKRMLEDNMQHKKIAQYFNVSRATITLISLNKTWKHVKF